MSEKERIFRRSKKPRNLRSKNSSLDETIEAKSDNEEDNVETRISDIKESQKVRERRNGMTAVECAVGKDLAREFDQSDEDPFRMKGGGMLRLSDDRKAALVAADIENDIKEQFKKETLLRDEHEEMRKYINEKLKRTNNNNNDEDSSKSKKGRINSVEEQILMKAAERIKGYVSKKSDELLSNQMLVGIPEVDLGIDVRMNNIIETEKKKMELFKKNK